MPGCHDEAARAWLADRIRATHWAYAGSAAANLLLALLLLLVTFAVALLLTHLLFPPGHPLALESRLGLAAAPVALVLLLDALVGDPVSQTHRIAHRASLVVVQINARVEAPTHATVASRLWRLPLRACGASAQFIREACYYVRWLRRLRQVDFPLACTLLEQLLEPGRKLPLRPILERHRPQELSRVLPVLTNVPGITYVATPEPLLVLREELATAIHGHLASAVW